MNKIPRTSHYTDVAYRVQNTGTEIAVGVTASFILEDLEVSRGEFKDKNDRSISRDIRDITTNQSRVMQSFTWDVGTLPPGETKELVFGTSLHTGYPYVLQRAGHIGMIRAEVSSLSPEPEILLANNIIKIYSLATSSRGLTRHMKGNSLALLLSVDALHPDANSDVKFDLNRQ